jgi:general stress protein 26
MSTTQGDPIELRKKFWHEMEKSPFLMLQLDADVESAAPMTAQLGRDANHEIWFFTSRTNRFAAMGAATATFASSGHDVFARFNGVLSEEKNRDRLEKLWSNMVAAWFPGGKDDPNLLMLHMKLGNASIWSKGELGLLGGVKMMLGMDVRADAAKSHVETAL